jgi:hypothetical protein
MPRERHYIYKYAAVTATFVVFVLRSTGPSNALQCLLVITGKAEALHDFGEQQHACVDQSCACPGARHTITRYSNTRQHSWGLRFQSTG